MRSAEPPACIMAYAGCHAFVGASLRTCMLHKHMYARAHACIYFPPRILSHDARLRPSNGRAVGASEGAGPAHKGVPSRFGATSKQARKKTEQRKPRPGRGALFVQQWGGYQAARHSGEM